MADQIPGTYNFGKVVSGDTITSKTITFDFSLAGYSAKLQMKRAAQDAAPVVDLQEGSGLQISGSSLIVDQFTAPTTDAGLILHYDLELTSPEGVRRTYLTGTLQVMADISR